VAVLNLRVTEHELTLGNYIIPKDSEIVVDTESIQKDEKIWEDPLTFNPDRFIQDQKDYTHMPFGGGKRICLGKPFAMMEIKSMIWYMLNNFRFKLINPEL